MAGGVHLCYYQKAGESMQMGVELEGSLRTQECTATVGYQIDLPKSNLTFRGLYTLYTDFFELLKTINFYEFYKPYAFTSMYLFWLE